MTARQLWLALLTELNKVNAPAILLEDFNYWTNVAVYKYINKRYSIYDINQQTTDDLRVLKSTVKIPIIQNSNINIDELYNDLTQVDLPRDYFHLLNCICEFQVLKPLSYCDKEGKYLHYKANRLTADMWGEVMNNYYMKPTYKRPYYYFNYINTFNSNVEISNSNSTSIANSNVPTAEVQNYRGTDLLNKLFIGKSKVYDNVNRESQIRYGNPSNVRMELRYGNDSRVKLNAVYVDYLKTPQNIILSQDELDLVDDTSQLLEFPDYVCLEIVNELVQIVMENASDPRLQTHIPVSQSIVSPTHEQTK